MNCRIVFSVFTYLHLTPSFGVGLCGALCYKRGAMRAYFRSLPASWAASSPDICMHEGRIMLSCYDASEVHYPSPSWHKIQTFYSCLRTVTTMNDCCKTMRRTNSSLLVGFVWDLTCAMSCRRSRTLDWRAANSALSCKLSTTASWTKQ